MRRVRQVQQRHALIFAAAFDDLTPMQWAALAKLAERGAASPKFVGSGAGSRGPTSADRSPASAELAACVMSMARPVSARRRSGSGSVVATSLVASTSPA